MLSSSLMGMVSTNAATSAATSGAAIENHTSGCGVDVRPAPPRDERAGDAAAEEERERAGERLLAVPWESSTPDPPADERRHPVADGQDGPGGRGDVEPVMERRG